MATLATHVGAHKGCCTPPRGGGSLPVWHDDCLGFWEGDGAVHLLDRLLGSNGAHLLDGGPG